MDNSSRNSFDSAVVKWLRFARLAWTSVRAATALLSVALFGVSGLAQADQTYLVSLRSSDASSVTGRPFEVSGSITTDGTIGYLGRSNILAWAFDISMLNLPTVVLAAGQSGTVLNCASASCGLNTDEAGNIYFNFGGNLGLAVGAYFGGPNGVPSVYLNGQPGFGSLSASAELGESGFVYGYGNTRIGQLSAVPESGTFLLLVVGLLLVMGVSGRGRVGPLRLVGWRSVNRR